MCILEAFNAEPQFPSASRNMWPHGLGTFGGETKKPKPKPKQIKEKGRRKVHKSKQSLKYHRIQPKFFELFHHFNIQN